MVLGKKRKIVKNKWGGITEDIERKSGNVRWFLIGGKLREKKGSAFLCWFMPPNS